MLEQEPIIYRPSSWFGRLDWGKVFPRPAPIEIDLGCGDGTFLIESAQRRPEHNFLGVERLLGRLRKVEKRARRLGLTNARALRIEASYAVQWLFPDESIAVYHVLFPDPWPKRRHWSRRLFQPEFVAQLHRTLQRGGVLNVATDHEEYFQEILQLCAEQKGFEWMEPETSAAAEVATDFEREFTAEGKTIFRLRVVKTE
jgi:tRNA (guanine-N7-)-methyltransferase